MDEESKTFLMEQLSRDPSLAHVCVRLRPRSVEAEREWQADFYKKLLTPPSDAEVERGMELRRILNRALRNVCDENYFDYNAR